MSEVDSDSDPGAGAESNELTFVNIVAVPQSPIRNVPVSVVDLEHDDNSAHAPFPFVSDDETSDSNSHSEPYTSSGLESDIEIIEPGTRSSAERDVPVPAEEFDVQMVERNPSPQNGHDDSGSDNDDEENDNYPVLLEIEPLQENDQDIDFDDVDADYNAYILYDEESDSDQDSQDSDSADDDDIEENNDVAESVLNMDNVNEPIREGSNVTKGQAFLTMMTLIIRHSLTNVCVEDILQLLTLMCPGALPSTRHLFYKNIKLNVENCRAHLFCERCLSYIGKYGDVQRNLQCPSCRALIDTEDIFKRGYFFLYLGIESQLKELLPRYNEQLLKKSTELQNPDVVTSPLNGRKMRRLFEHGEVTDDDITMMWNCDGAPIFKSSKRAIWPIQLTVNEIHSHDNKILAGLWLHSEKPPNHTFLKPFADEMKVLGTHGFLWGNGKRSKAFALCCTSDACARPLLRYANQFNGHFGCDFCLHEGEEIPRGNGFSRIYEPREGVALRTAESFVADAYSGSEENPTNGVKGVSKLMFLPKFDMVEGFVPDYLHCVCYGVMRMLTGLWLNSKNHGEPFYIGTRITDINNRLTRLKPPSEVKRVPRSLSLRKFWKASEFRSFLLFYALIVLQGILRPAYHRHLYLLAFAVHLVTQNSVTLQAIQLAENALRKFVGDIPRLYSREYSTFNVHQLLHIPNAVRDWGPLHLTSTFRFESNIGDLVSMVRGTKCVTQQIVKTFSMRCYLPRLIHENFGMYANGKLRQIVNRLLCSGYYIRKHRRTVNDINLYGKPTLRKLNNTELFALFTRFGRNAKHESRFYEFHNAIAVGSLYLTMASKRSQTRHSDSVASDRNGENFALMSCCVGNFTCECDECDCPIDVVLFVKPLVVIEMAFSRRNFDRGESFSMISRTANILHCKFPREMTRKCFYVEKNDGTHFVIPLPNTSDVY